MCKKFGDTEHVVTFLILGAALVFALFLWKNLVITCTQSVDKVGTTCVGSVDK